MQIQNLVAITGLPGLHKVIGNRQNGLIVENLSSGSRKFVSVRRYQFTPLEGIGIYIDTGETIPISDVFGKMTEQYADNPPPAADTSNETLREYFLDILPQHDQKRVRNSDIRKLVTWYAELKNHGLLSAADEEE